MCLQALNLPGSMCGYVQEREERASPELHAAEHSSPEPAASGAELSSAAGLGQDNSSRAEHMTPQMRLSETLQIPPTGIQLCLSRPWQSMRHSPQLQSALTG